MAPDHQFVNPQKYRMIEKEIDKILISQNLQPDKQNIEYKGLVQRWIELKLKRQDWKKDLLNKSGKNDEDFQKEIEKVWNIELNGESKEFQPSIITEESEPIEPYDEPFFQSCLFSFNSIHL